MRAHRLDVEAALAVVQHLSLQQQQKQWEF